MGLALLAATVAVGCYAKPTQPVLVEGGAALTGDSARLLDSILASGRSVEAIAIDSLVLESLGSAYQSLSFNLKSVEAFTADMHALPSRLTGAEIWSGRLLDGTGDVVLVRAGGEIDGFVVREGGEQLRIREILGVGRVVEAVKKGERGNELAPILPEPFVPFADASVATPCPPSTIDVLVVYDPDDVSSLGGASAVAREALGAAEYVNIAMRNNGLAHRVFIVGVSPIQFVSTTDLGRVINDAALSRVRGLETLRDNSGADVVFFWMPDGGPDCGLTWVLDNTPGGRPDLAYVAVARRCAISTWTFAHELGHQLGAEHDRTSASSAESPAKPARPYGYGYQDLAMGVRDIMATACKDVYCDRLAYYSSPAASHGGRPFGIPFETQPDSSADVARLIDQTACVVAAYRSPKP